MQNISPLILDLLKKRGIEQEEEVQAFLSPNYDTHTHDPFLLVDMDVAVSRILRAVSDNERIAIYADYDCDGIPGASILSDFFIKVGHANYEIYIPHRDREGYGVHADALRKLKDNGVSLIITVDVGISAVSETAIARGLGMDMIITDHHEIIGQLPDALAVINPKRAPYPFADLCGAAVAYKLAQGVLHGGRKIGLANFATIPDGWEKWLLDLVAIATVADMVPLIGENRVFAHWGLRVLRKTRRKGIRALCSIAKVRLSDITEETISFTFAPRINASSRMGNPEIALQLLIVKDDLEANNIAYELERLNTSRKTRVASIVKEARKRVATRYNDSDLAVTLGDITWKPALAGLVAQSLLSGRSGVVCVWGADANGSLKGSCRSDGSISIVSLFKQCPNIFSAYGGHNASGGFTLLPEFVHEFPSVLHKAVNDVERSIVASRAHDACVTLREISMQMVDSLAEVSPFGVGNPKPILRISDLRITSLRRFGKEKNHLELRVCCARTAIALRAYRYFASPEDFSVIPTQGLQISLLATIERDTYRGGRDVVLRIVDIVG